MYSMKVAVHNKVSAGDHAGGGASDSSTISRPPAPFLKKIFHMVDDPKTDNVISWSSKRKSFIIWDFNKLSADVLPKYFRSGNIMTFTCQLNTYGFKKIGWERTEFQHEWFRKGKPQWLVKIKRKYQQPQNKRQQGARRPLPEPDSLSNKVGTEFEEQDKSTNNSKLLKVEKLKGPDFVHETLIIDVDEMEILRNDNKLLKFEIQKLKGQQEDIEKEMLILQQRMHADEFEQLQMAKTFPSLSQVQHFIEKIKQEKKSCSSPVVMEKISHGPESIQSLEEPQDAVETTNHIVTEEEDADSAETCTQIVNEKNQTEEEWRRTQSIIQAMRLTDDPSTLIENNNANAISLTKILQSDNYEVMEKLFNEDLNCEIAEESESWELSSMVSVAMQDLWGGYM